MCDNTVKNIGVKIRKLKFLNVSLYGPEFSSIFSSFHIKTDKNRWWWFGQSFSTIFKRSRCYLASFVKLQKLNYSLIRI